MLTYFPTPYPGEWWYSVLCRYHERSGNPKSQTTVRELFGNTTAAMAALYPNGSIHQLVSKLPPGFITEEDVTVSHTLFQYFTRFFPLPKKNEILDRIRRGESTVITSIVKYSDMKTWQPRYCPMCARCDREEYGEAYWHISHQIQLMPLCPDHKCRLLSIDTITASHMSYIFFSLESVLSDQLEPDYTAKKWERPLSNILREYLTLPLFPSQSKNQNLAMTLSNMGYGVIQASSPHVILDAKRLYGDLVDFYGGDIVKRFFGDEKSICMINRICKWEGSAPERYALLQCFSGISTELLFDDNTVIEDSMKMKLVQYQMTEKIYGRKGLAEKMGITVSQLGLLAKKYNITPFWTRDANSEKLTRRITGCFTEEEMQKIEAVLRENPTLSASQFVRQCVLSNITTSSFECLPS